jgi:hypothetical protein
MERRIGRIGPMALGLMAVALFSAGCGSSRTPVSAVPKAAATTGSAQPSAPAAGASMLNYSKCMRSHGVAGYPDPNANGQISIQPGQAGFDPASASFKGAEQACRSLMPGGTAQVDKDKAVALKYAACMRKNGLPKFPDPNAQGGIQMNGDVGNPDSPIFKAAVKACESLQPGGPNAGQLPNPDTGT